MNKWAFFQYSKKKHYRKPNDCKLVWEKKFVMNINE